MSNATNLVCLILFTKNENDCANLVFSIICCWHEQNLKNGIISVGTRISMHIAFVLDILVIWECYYVKKHDQ